MAERGHDRRGPASVTRSARVDRADGKDAWQCPVAPEPVPEEVVARAKALFRQRVDPDVSATSPAVDSASEFADNSGSSSSTDEIAS